MTLSDFREYLERIRRHEARGGANATAVQPRDIASHEAGAQPPRGASSFLTRFFKRVLESSPRSEPTRESLDAIPEHLVTLARVIDEEPKFERWIFAIEPLPVPQRNEQLDRLVSALRIDGDNTSVADSFEALRQPALFKAFCQFLRQEQAGGLGK